MYFRVRECESKGVRILMVCMCVCAEHLMISDGACVSDCGEGRKEVDRVCRDCDGGVCDKG